MPRKIYHSHNSSEDPEHIKITSEVAVIFGIQLTEKQQKNRLLISSHFQICIDKNRAIMESKFKSLLLKYL